MTDGATLSAALTSAKTAFDLLKVLRDSGSAFKTAEFQLKFADAISALSEVRVQLADVQELMREKDARVVELEKALEDKAAVVRVHDAYYRVAKDGKHYGAPYCLRCWEGEGRLRSLVATIGNHTMCPACKAVYDAPQTGTFGPPPA